MKFDPSVIDHEVMKKIKKIIVLGTAGGKK